MPGPSSCTVSFVDSEGIRHSVQVTAESLFEAAALAVKAFRKMDLMEAEPGIATVLEVSVCQPAVTHHVTLGKLNNWLAGDGMTPREQALKHRIRELLG